MELKQANSAQPATHFTTTAKASAPPSALTEEEPEITDPSNPKSVPFAFADFTWLNGNARTKDTPYATRFFTPEIRSDVNYTYDFRHPQDDTISGSSEIFRSNEVQVTQLGVGGNFHYDNVRARLMTQFGLYSETTPRNDASPHVDSGTSRTHTAMSRRPMAAITSTSSMALTSTPASSCPTSACSPTTSSTTGRISRRMSRPTRPGSSTACACSGFRRQS
jgi:hypothetical protein